MITIGRASYGTYEGGNKAARDLLFRMFTAAVETADPRIVLPPHLPLPPRGRCVVVGAGKAAASMAAAVERAWPHVELSGAVVTPYGHFVPTNRIKVREAGHPVPDENSVLAAREILDCVRGLTADDLVLGLMSGGGSSTLCLPAAGLTLEDKQAVNRTLLASGLDIRTMNALRKRMSAIKGGKLALAASPAQVFTLAISDIPGDDPSAIASGPTVVDPNASIDLSAVVERLARHIPAHVVQHLMTWSDTSSLGHHELKLIATPAMALSAAADIARSHGVTPVMLGDHIEGESHRVAANMAELAKRPVEQPLVFISGGETTVTLNANSAGRGGRNTEFALSLICKLQGASNVWAIAADTDGEDGNNAGAAGAIVGPDTISRADAAGIDPMAALAAHDSGPFFESLGDLVKIGPTRTNVNDFRAILVLPKSNCIHK